MGEVKVKWQAPGVNGYSQCHGFWAKEDYKWDEKKGAGAPTFYKLGCSITALTNVLWWAVEGKNAPTPSDANNKSKKFYDALEKIYFRCLKTGNKLYFKRDNGLIFDGGTHSPVAMNSGEYKEILRRARIAISKKHPVLLSYTACKDKLSPEGFMHSVIAVTVDINDKIHIIDPYNPYGNAVYAQLDTCVNVTPCKQLYKAYECIRWQ